MWTSTRRPLLHLRPRGDDGAGALARLGTPSSRPSSSPPQSLHILLGGLLSELRASSASEPLRPTELMRAGKRALPDLFDTRQHDAHELMHELLDTLHTSTQRPLCRAELEIAQRSRSCEWHAALCNGTPPPPFAVEAAARAIQSPKAAAPASASTGRTPPPTPPAPPTTSAVASLFSGSVVSMIRCHGCERPSLTIEPLVDFSIEVIRPSSSTKLGGREKGSSSSLLPSSLFSSSASSRQKKAAGGAEEDGVPLSDCLRSFFASEKLCGDDAYHCERCAALKPAEKTLRLLALPGVTRDPSQALWDDRRRQRDAEADRARQFPVGWPRLGRVVRT